MYMYTLQLLVWSMDLFDTYMYSLVPRLSLRMSSTSSREGLGTSTLYLIHTVATEGIFVLGGWLREDFLRYVMSSAQEAFSWSSQE